MESPARSPTVDWQRHRFVQGLQPEHLAILNSCAMVVEFEAGQTIFLEGEPANRFYLILSGSIALKSRAMDSRVTLITTLGEGEVLGWSWLFPPYRWHFDAMAVEATRAVFFYGTWLRHTAEENHELGYELMRRMAEVLIRRLQATRRQIQSGPESFPAAVDDPRVRVRRLRS